MLFSFLCEGMQTLVRPIACCNTTGTFPDITPVNKMCGYLPDGASNDTAGMYYIEVSFQIITIVGTPQT